MRLSMLLLPVLLSVCSAMRHIPFTSGKWSPAPPYPIGVWEAGGGVIGTKQLGYYYFVAGGFLHPGFPAVTNRTYGLRLTPDVAKEYRRLADMPEALTHMAQAIDGQYFYGAGGYHGAHPGPSSRLVYRYDLATDKWSRLPDLPARRSGGGLVIIKSRWLVFSGGVDRPTRSMRVHIDHGDTWSLDLRFVKQGWRDDKSMMPHPRNHLAAINTCGRYLWVGGQLKSNEHTGNLPEVSQYMPRRKFWVTKDKPANLPLPLGHISASVMPYRCSIIAVGGTTQGKRKTKQVLWWDRHKNRWQAIGNYTKSVATPVCGLLGQKLYCGTGSTWRRKEVFVTDIQRRWVSD